MERIIIVHPKELSDVDKKKLEDKGNIVIETESPESIRIVTDFSEVEANAFTLSALEALSDVTSSDNNSKRFVVCLFKRLSKKK